MDKKLLDGWVMHYNSFRGVYEAVKREHYFQLFSGDGGDVLRSSEVSTLEELIMKTSGDKDKLNSLVGDINFQEQYPI